MQWEAADVAERVRRDKPAEPMLPFWFQRRLFESAWAITQIAGTAIFMLWVRVAFEVAIVLFNIATTLTTIEKDIKEHTQTADV